MDALTKALQQTTGSGQYLIPEDLNPVIMEYLGRLSPLWQLMPKKQAEGKTHEYVKRTAVPSAWFEGELTATTASSSTYTRESQQLKILRTWGGVSGYQQAVSERFVNALQAELIGSLEGLAEMVEWSVIFGNDIDTYQINGLATQMEEDSTAKTALASGGNILNVDGVVTLTHLDNMIDRVNSYRAAQRDARAFLMSNEMISKVSGLQTRVARNVDSVEFPGGLRFSSYRGVPLLPASYATPAVTTTSPAATATKGAGGSLADDEYFYVIASVTDAGEQLHGTENSATTETTNNKVVLTWTADANAKLYKIYRALTTGTDNHGLLATVAAKTYASDGAISTNVATWTDDGTYTPNTNVKPLTTGEQSIFLVDLDAQRGLQSVGMMSPLGERTETFFNYIPLATRKSAFEYMIEGFMAALVPYPQLHAMARRVKLA